MVSGQSVELQVPFESLLAFVAELDFGDKLRLWKVLDELIGQAEEGIWEQDPDVQPEIREARAAYQAGDYVAIDEYLAQRHEKA